MDTTTGTLADFLLARIAEDEARDERWDFLIGVEHHSVGCELINAHTDYSPVCDCDGPKRWIAECESKRRIVERHQLETTNLYDGFGKVLGTRDYCGLDRHNYPCPDLRDLASVYADHPDYRDEWRA